MKFSCSWLAQYVELPADSAELAARLTAAGLAVEYIELQGDDTILDIDVTTNRVDAMNHLGLAREISALYDRPLRRPSAAPAEITETTASTVRIRLEDPSCPRFAARVVRGVTVAESPAWLKARLQAIGLRPINNVVDVTNFILFELGQPLHAYDLATIRGAELRVRRGVAGETLKTLDGVERKLDDEILLITDAERPVGIGGIMGGLDTEVTPATKDVLIEGAHFRPTTVRRGAKQLGMHTDAKHRFERGADPEICAYAVSRAAELIAEVAGGQVLAGVIEERHPDAPDFAARGRVELARLNRFLGVTVEGGQVERWLGRLGFELVRAGEGVWNFHAPSWRYYDMQPFRADGTVYEQDFFEEVARLHGLDPLPATLPRVEGNEPPPSAALVRRKRTRRVLAAAGYAEAINFAFHDGAEADRLPSLRPEVPALLLANPLSDRYAAMRRSLVPGLLESARFNQRRGASKVALFEIGNLFFERSGETFPEEVEALALITGGAETSPWQGGRTVDLFDAKGALEVLAETFGLTLGFRAAACRGLLEGTAAELLLGERVVGYLGRLEDEEHFPLYVAELALAELGVPPVARKIEVPARLPGVSTDLTLTHALDVAWDALAALVAEAAPPALKRVELKDRYQGKGVPDGAVNTTLSFHYHADDRTLTMDEVNGWQEALARRLEECFGWRAAGKGEQGDG